MDALETYRTLLCRNRRLSAQLRLFDALSKAPGRTRPLLSLIEEDRVSESSSTHRSDNGRRAVHERAKALQRTLRVYSSEFGSAIGQICWVTWGSEEGDTRSYRLETAPADRRIDTRAHRRVAEIRNAARRLVQMLDESRGAIVAARAFEMQRLVEQLGAEIDSLMRSFGGPTEPPGARRPRT